MLGSSQQDFPVVDKNEKLTGIISMTDLREAMADRVAHSRLSARDISMTTGVMAVKMDDTLNEALRAHRRPRRQGASGCETERTPERLSPS